MTTRHPLSQHQHSHSPNPDSDHTHSDIHFAGPAPRPSISRRRFLLASAATLAGAMLVRLEHVTGHPLFSTSAVQKHIYLAPDDHTDYFWTADAATYQTAFLAMLDYYIQAASDTAGNLPPYQSRWNCDGSFWVWVYQHNRSAAQFQSLINLISDGHISVPLNPLCVVLGGAPAEAVLRGMYYPGQLERRYNLNFTLAYAMENQTLPYGIGALWAGSGAKYSWKGICGCATKVPDPGNREHDIYWWVGPDGSKILMKWNSLLNNMPGLQQPSQGMGGYAEAYNTGPVVDYVDTDSSFIQRFSYNVIGAFGKGWDGLQTLTQDFVTIAKAKTTAGRQVIVSNEHDFVEDFEPQYGASLPSLSCTFGNEWELNVASLAEASARVKRAVEKLRGAEALATLVSLKQPAFMTGREAARDQAFLDLGLYWEHCWPADSPYIPNPKAQRRDWQRQLVTEIEAYVNPLFGDAAAALGGMIQKSGVNERFFVFNPLSWARTDIADYAYSGSTNVRVIDVATSQEVPAQIVTVDGTSYLRVLASNVPAVGYKVFEIQPAGQAAPLNHDMRAGQAAGVGNPVYLPMITTSSFPSVNGNVIQNEFYQITLAPNGAITSLWDNLRNREFVRTIGGYAINDLGGSSGTVTVENAGPVSATLKATISSPIAHISRITLVRGLDRIDIRNDITQNFSDVLKWRFGFEITSPDVWHEEVGAIIRAKYTTNGGHYYRNSQHLNARYDWLTLNRFADMSGGGVGITLANADCYYMQLGNSTTTALDTVTPQISVLAGGQVDGASYGIPSQGNVNGDGQGDTHFLQRFALQTHDAYDQAAAMRMALESQNPLITGTVTGGSLYPADQFSLLTISNSNVLLSALKPADDGIGTGIVARLWNLGSTDATCALALPNSSILSASELSHIETPLAAFPVNSGILNIPLKTQQLRTFSIKPGT